MLKKGQTVRLVRGKDLWVLHSFENGAASGKRIWKAYYKADSTMIVEAYEGQLLIKRKGRWVKVPNELPSKIWYKPESGPTI